MALIKCPECGREKVSSIATACPECGFPIKQHFENIDHEVVGTESSILQDVELIYFEASDGKTEVSFDSGLADGTRGKHKCNTGIFDYWVVGNQLHIAMPAGEACYTICENFLLNNKSKFDGYIPDGNLVNASCKQKSEMGSLLGTGDDVKTFSSDGRYSEVFWGEKSTGHYKKKDDLIAISAGSTGNKFSGEVVYNNTLYFTAYLSPAKAEEMRTLLAEASPQTNRSTQNTSEADVGIVKCPFCQSTSVKKLGSVGRLASIGFWGLASSKVGKQWHCKNCNSDF